MFYRKKEIFLPYAITTDKTILTFSRLFVSVSLATTASYLPPGVSVTDKLRLAASKGQIDKVKELLAAGVPCDPDREGRTALHYR